ncbi:MAG: hypothetical protein MZU91_14810 [Desulfosudis oleivorans]|nr:hypothetical protein [Desulfosudis oleivorans]
MPGFPVDNIWNTSVADLPWIPTQTLLSTPSVRRGDFTPTSDPAHGTADHRNRPTTWSMRPQPKVNVSFDYADESDPGPYPIPPDALIEGGSQSSGDRHVLVLDRGNCILYELYSAYPQPDGSWQAGSGAVFDLNSNALRPSGWTSADAAGIADPLGLVRYDEVAAGEIRHALRFTAPQTRRDLCLARPPPSLESHRGPDPADGTALSPESRFRYLAVLRPGPGHPAGHEDLRSDPGGQRLGLVHYPEYRIPAGTTTHWSANWLGSKVPISRRSTCPRLMRGPRLRPRCPKRGRGRRLYQRRRIHRGQQRQRWRRQLLSRFFSKEVGA